MGNPLGGPVPPAPDLTNVATSPYAEKAAKPPVSSPADIGQANKGAQVLSGVTGVIQGLQQGFAQKQMEKFNQAKSSYSISKAQYDAAAQRLATLKPTDSDYNDAKAHFDQASKELADSSKGLVDLVHGGGGKGGKNADPRQEGLIGKALDMLMGRHHPAVTAGAPAGTPPFVGSVGSSPLG